MPERDLNLGLIVCLYLNLKHGKFEHLSTTAVFWKNILSVEIKYLYQFPTFEYFENYRHFKIWQ